MTFEKETLEKIGSKFTTLRKAKGYTSHEDFALDHNLPRVQYWRIEKGKTNLTVRSILKILEVHNITIEEFFRETPKA